MTIDYKTMPDPLQSVDYGCGAFGPAMWHYCDDCVSWSSLKEIARSNGYDDLCQMSFYNDKDLEWSDDADMPEIVRREEAGEDILSDWIPTPPDGDGWILTAKYNAEDDGPVAIFLRRKVQNDASGEKRL